ncbi:MAG: uroporphyrinogen-III synthase [Rhodospirillaceae bacterium]|nr:uroporphyrinogen-III synthase [Rhodospirillaceae bacterium]
MQLKLFGHDVVTAPTLTPRPVPWPVSALDGIDALVVTSQVAVKCLEQFPVSRDLPVFAVGPSTAAASLEAGFNEVTNGGGTAEKLLHTIDTAAFKRGLYLSARQVSRDLAHDRPSRIKRQIIYDMTPAQSLPDLVINMITSGQRVVVPFYSPRAFQVFESLIAHHGLGAHISQATAIAIHHRIFEAQTLSWGQIHVAAAPDGEGMIEALKTAA